MSGLIEESSGALQPALYCGLAGEGLLQPQPGARRVSERSAVSRGCHFTDGEAVVQSDGPQTKRF